MTQSFHTGPELLVNSQSGKKFEHSTMETLADGRFIVGWMENGGSGVRSFHAQIFNADGSLSGDEFPLGQSGFDNQFFQFGAQIAGLDTGGFAVSWTDYAAPGTDRSNFEIFVQLYDASGAKIGDSFVAPTTTDRGQANPTLATLSDGRFVVTWTDGSGTGADTDSLAVRAQIFNADGSTSGTEFLVNTATSEGQFRSAVTALSGGKFVVTWMDHSRAWPDTSSHAVRMQVFNSDGTKFGLEQVVNTTTRNSQEIPEVAELADGRFVITWSDVSYSGGDLSGYAVRAQIFYANGVRYGGEFLVNTTTDYSQVGSQVTGLPDGKFVIVWSDSSTSGDDTRDWAVRAQVFNANGTRFGEEFLVNTTTERSQNSPDIEALADGRFAISWTDEGRSGDWRSTDISAQIFDTRETSVVLNGTNLNDQFVGTAFKDHLKGADGADKLWGGGQRDLLSGGNGNDLLQGDGGRDRLFGNGGNDRLFGGNGNDRLNGGGGRDKLNGGKGDDVMTGGAGFDTFVFTRGNDVVTDFNALHRGEKIDLSRATGITDYTDLIAAHTSQVGSDVVIDDLAGNTLTLTGVNLTDLGADDFMF